jgi:hypothetical protein
MPLEGGGAVTATAMVVTMGHGNAYNNGRPCAAGLMSAIAHRSDRCWQTLITTPVC